MPTIENYATINYTSGGVAVTKVSNLAEIQLESSVAFTKSTLGTTYSDSSIVTYILTITNTSSSAINNVVITDDLGSFTEGTLELTPLSYLAPAQLFINGQNCIYGGIFAVFYPDNTIAVIFHKFFQKSATFLHFFSYYYTELF